MEFYIKNEKGELVKASIEDVFNRGITLYDAKGKEVKRTEPVVKPPVIDKQDSSIEVPAVHINNSIQELTGLIKDLARSQSAITEKAEKQEEKLKIYEEMVKSGFILPSGQTTTKGYMASLENDGVLKNINLGKAGADIENYVLNTKHRIPDEKRERIAKWALLVYKAGVNKDPMATVQFWKEFGKDAKEMEIEHKTAVGDSGNIFPIVDVVESEVLAFARERSIALQYARVVPMTAEKKTWPAESASSSVSWGNTTAESEPTVADVELDAEELSAYAAVKNMTLADSPSDVVGWLLSNMSEAVALELDNVTFNGDGASSMASCSGILSAACGYSVTMTGSWAFSNLDATRLSEMISKLSGIRKVGARFYMHGEILHFIRSLKDSQNRPIFVETFGNATMPSTIWGYPFSEVTNMPSTTAENTAFLSFGNLQYFLIGRRKGVGRLEVDPYGLFTTNRTRFKIYSRWALIIGLATGFCRLLTGTS